MSMLSLREAERLAELLKNREVSDYEAAPKLKGTALDKRIAELKDEMSEILARLRLNASDNAARRRLWSLTVQLDALEPKRTSGL